jgi:hypothetical protein
VCATETRLRADAILPDPSVPFKSWAEAFHVHPDCLKLPPALPGEVAALASDIARQGVLMPLVFRIPEGKTTDDAELLDGRNRLEALTQLGYRFAWVKGKGPWMRDPDGAVTELRFELKTAGEVPFPLEHIVSLNVVRRHWTTAQKREIITELLKDIPERSDRETARLVGVDNKTVGAVRAHLEDLGELMHLDETVGRDGKARTTSPRRPKPAAEDRPPVVKVETEQLARLQTARTARDSGDLFSWQFDGSQKIAHVLVQDGMAQSSLNKVELVLKAGLREAERLRAVGTVPRGSQK